MLKYNWNNEISRSCTDLTCYIEIGNSISADKILIGNVKKMNNEFVFGLELINVKTTEKKSLKKSCKNNLDSLFVLIEDSVEELIADKFIKSDFYSKLKALNFTEEQQKMWVRRDMCAKNNMQSCYELGLAENEIGKVNKAKALFRKACSGNVYQSCGALGVLEEKGGSLNTAKQLYVNACNSGDIKRCSNLKLIDGKFDEARLLLEKSCLSGDNVGCFNLAYLELNKYNNYKKAKTIYSKLCKDQVAKACYSYGKLEDKYDKGKATKLFKKACKFGYPESCYDLGVLKSASRETAKAKKFYSMACNGELTKACYSLGVIEDQIGNEKAAIHLFKKVAKEGYLKGYIGLGHIKLKSGNEAKAFKLYKMACDKGEPLGCKEMNEIKSQEKRSDLRITGWIVVIAISVLTIPFYLQANK